MQFIEFLKDIVNFISDPRILISLAAVFLFVSLKWPQKFYSDKAAKILFAVMIGFFVVSLLDEDFRKVVTKPDNVPIVGMLFLIPFFTWFSLREAVRNDQRSAEGKQLIEQEETADKVLTWPDLVYTELICLVVLTVVLIGWSMVLGAPLEDPANPQASPNPSKAPWYFLGLQEMLVYYDPWLAGVVFPGLIIVGLGAIPYIDNNPKGNGYYTLKDRKWEIGTFLFGFLILWILLVVLGTFLRGPNWNFFGPYEYWDRPQTRSAEQHQPFGDHLDQNAGDGAAIVRADPGIRRDHSGSGVPARSPAFVREEMVQGLLRVPGTDSLLRHDVPAPVDGSASDQDGSAMAAQPEVHRGNSGILF